MMTELEKLASVIRGDKTERDDMIRDIRKSFSAFIDQGKFNVCDLFGLKGFDHKTFSKDVRALHCEPLTPEMLEYVKRYVVAYFMCPDTEDPLELEACYEEVFPSPPEPKWETKFKLGPWRLQRVVTLRDG